MPNMRVIPLVRSDNSPFSSTAAKYLWLEEKRRIIITNHHSE
jgi:hypothetical protein